MGLLDTLRSKGLLSGQAALDFTRGGLMGATTDLLGYPVDLATMAMRPLGYNVEKPVGGSEWLAGLLTSPSGSKMETAGRVVGGMLTPGPEDVARMTGLLAPKKGPMQELITYHSSPHRINNVDEANPVGKFDLSKIGTGEGAQAYGHGIYLSEDAVMNKNHYYKKFAHDPRATESAWLDGVELAHLPETWQQIDPVSFAARSLDNVPAGLSADGRAQYAIRALRKQYPDAPFDFEDAVDDAARKVTANAVERRKGHFYTVDLPDEHIAKMLDWDAPLSEQPEILETLRKAGLVDGDTVQGLEMARGPISAITGEQVIDDLAMQWGNDYGMDSLLSVEAANGREAASKYLRSLGIPGIKYFDGGSRAAGEGTRNFVIFSPDVVKILKRE